MTQLPLGDIRVVDISTVLAGPNCARYLADFGADVIKVERPDTGDSLRNMAWRDPRDGTGLWWKMVNRNKRTIALNLKDEADSELLLSLLDDAHVLVEKFSRTQTGALVWWISTTIAISMSSLQMAIS
jgi:crotonobetainyl-CoA:carnitine CoA-transferase CaiB-like acyl-CoA transferase